MIQIIRNLPNGIKVYVCDKKDELSKIDFRTTTMGTTCYVIENSTTYILNGSKTWVKKNSGTSSSSSSSGDDDNTYVMDGDEII